MFCTQCGQKNDDGNSFCIYCGTPLVNSADEVGTIVEPESPVESPFEPTSVADPGATYDMSDAVADGAFDDVVVRDIVIEETDDGAEALVIESTTLIETLAPDMLALMNTATHQTFPILSLPCTIGRADDSPVKFPDRTTVSREHAELKRGDGRFSIKDLGSLNGTKVNDQPISSGLWVPIDNGDVLTLADVDLIVLIKEAP